MELFIVTQQRDDFNDTPELGEKAFHRFPKDQETVSNSLPGKQHGPHLRTRGCLPGPVTLEKTHLHLEEEKKWRCRESQSELIYKIIKLHLSKSLFVQDSDEPNWRHEISL